MNGLLYTLRTLEPVLANSLGGDANSAQSLPYVPGGLVRGALAALYLDGQPLDEEDPRQADFRRLFLRPETRYLHAYVAVKGERQLPTPLSWRRVKHTREPIYDLALGDPGLDELKRPPFAFFRLTDGLIQWRKMDTQVYVHTQRDAVLGRADTRRGAVYRYESLPAGVELRGAILTTSTEDTVTLIDLLRGRELPLGKARTAGYGLVQVVAIEELTPDWQELRTRPTPDYEPLDDYGDETRRMADSEEGQQPPDDVAEFWLRFLSAGLLRGPAGQFTLDPTTALHARLGPAISLVENETFRQGEIVGGFNRQWGTYLPQAVAVAPGSVFRCRAETPISRAALDALEQTGLGERRGEGFGRVAVLTELVDEMRVSEWKPEEGDTSEPAPLSAEARQLAQHIAERILRAELDEALLNKAPYPHTNTPPRAQLGRWRVVVRGALAEIANDEDGRKTAEQHGRVLAFVKGQRGLTDKERAATDRDSAGGRDGSRGQKRGWQKMNRAWLRYEGGETVRLGAWIEEVLSGLPSRPELRPPWHILFQGGRPPEVKLGDIVAKADDLAAEYQLRLIDIVLQRLRRADNEGGNHEQS